MNKTILRVVLLVMLVTGITLAVMGAGVLSAPLAGGLAGAFGPLGALGMAGGALLVFIGVIVAVTRIGRIA